MIVTSGQWLAQDGHGSAVGRRWFNSLTGLVSDRPDGCTEPQDQGPAKQKVENRNRPEAVGVSISRYQCWQRINQSDYEPQGRRTKSWTHREDLPVGNLSR